MFDILVMPDGKCLIVSEDDLRPEEMEAIHRAFDQWREGDGKGLLVANAKVRLIEDVELSLT